MPPSKHAVLSASSSHRWLNCNPSARLELEFEDRETEAAAEGTAAHALCEHKLRRALKMRSKKPVSPYDSDEMDAYTDGYVQFVMEALEEARQVCPDSQIMIEQRLDFSCYVPDGFGTGDCLIVSDHLLHIIDFKYGQGVLVEAENNPQMMLYALGALRSFDFLYDVDLVAMTIYQPRRENVSTWTNMSPAHGASSARRRLDAGHGLKRSWSLPDMSLPGPRSSLMRRSRRSSASWTI